MPASCSLQSVVYPFLNRYSTLPEEEVAFRVFIWPLVLIGAWASVETIAWRPPPHVRGVCPTIEWTECAPLARFLFCCQRGIRRHNGDNPPAFTRPPACLWNLFRRTTGCLLFAVSSHLLTLHSASTNPSQTARPVAPYPLIGFSPPPFLVSALSTEGI